MRTLFLLALVACAGSKDETDTATDATDADTDTDSDSDSDADTDTDTDTDTDSDADTDTGELEVIRDPRFDAAADVLLQELDVETNLATAASIAVCQGGEVLWREGFGTAVPEAQEPVTPSHAFQIGSTTKHMTSAVVLQQVQDGLYTLDDTVSTVLPSLVLPYAPAFTEQASIHELISHQGGLSDYLDWLGSPDDAELAAWHYGAAPLSLYEMAPPGTFYNYSNPNFTIAGLAVEEHDPADRYFADIMQDDLFAPLGLSSTFMRKQDLLDAGVPYVLSTGLDLATYGYQPIPMEEVPDVASIRPAGMVWSTPDDMCRWGAFVMHGDPAVLDDALRAQITTPQVSTLYYDEHESYGYGMFVHDLWPMLDGSFYPIEVWEHGGNTLSFTSSFLLLPDQDVVISLLSNGYGDAFYATVEETIKAVVDPLPDPSDYQPAFDPYALEIHTGSYESVALGPFTISAGGAYGLQIAAPILAQYGYTYDADLQPISTDVWILIIDGFGYDLTFIRDPEGDPTQYVRNRSFVGVRVEDEPNAARSARPDPATVEAALRSVRAL
jgi:CubicO group peptidase (beta-lactamase class C family)